MRFELVVLVLTFVVKHSIASRDESTCSFADESGKISWCWGPLENLQCNAPTFDDYRKCKSKNETIALFDELLTNDLAQKNKRYKNWIMRSKRLLTNKFEDNPPSTCINRKEGLASRGVRLKIDKIKE